MQLGYEEEESGKTLVQPIIEMRAPEFLQNQHKQVIAGNTVFFPFRPYES